MKPDLTVSVKEPSYQTNQRNYIYVEYLKAMRWDGVLPKVTGGNSLPLIKMD